jgi:hypothetical protein
MRFNHQDEAVKRILPNFSNTAFNPNLTKRIKVRIEALQQVGSARLAC